MTLPMFEQERIEKARGCDSCLDWHNICGAECCKSMSFTGITERLRPYGLVRIPLETMSNDLKWYYELHGAIVEDNTVLLRLKDFKQEGSTLKVFSRCKNLTEDLRCKEHSTGNRPKACIDFNKESATLNSCTFNCLFKYKILGGNQ